jgi:hypothetical protein
MDIHAHLWHLLATLFWRESPLVTCIAAFEEPAHDAFRTKGNATHHAALLTSPATASAECSWVLWPYAVGKGMDLHSIELARPMTQPKRDVE